MYEVVNASGIPGYESVLGKGYRDFPFSIMPLEEIKFVLEGFREEGRLLGFGSVNEILYRDSRTNGVSYLVKTKRLRPVKMGGDQLYRPGDVLELLESGCGWWKGRGGRKGPGRIEFLEMGMEETMSLMEKLARGRKMITRAEANEAIYLHSDFTCVRDLVRNKTLKTVEVEGKELVPARGVLNLMKRGYGKWKNYKGTRGMNNLNHPAKN